MELRLAYYREQLTLRRIEYDRLFSSAQVLGGKEKAHTLEASNRKIEEIMELRRLIAEMVHEVVFAKFQDGKKEVYSKEVHGVEKPGVVAYQVREITKDKWEWILTHPDPKEAVDRYFPNI